MKTFDRTVIVVVLALGVGIGALAVASVRIGPTVDGMTTVQTFDGTSVNTAIGVSFTEAMIPASVERNFRVTPRVKGEFSWSGNQLIFLPRGSLLYNTTYTVTVGSASQSTSGKHLFRDFAGSFKTQTEHLLFLGSQGVVAGRLVLASIGGASQVVGSDDGLVAGLSLSADRSLVVYDKRGGPGQRVNELWLLSLVDNSYQLLYRHADWDMSQPHFSPDGRYIVFLATNVMLCQKYYGCYRDKSGPIIYLLDLHSKKVFPFRSKTDVPITDFIDFSPGGQLAYTDLGSALTLAAPDGTHVVHVPDLGNSPQFSGFDLRGDKAAFVGQTPESPGGDILVYTRGKYVDVSKGVYDSSTPAFSTSGSTVAYAAYRGEKGIEPIYGVNVYDFKSHNTLHATSERDWSDWSPQWSYDDRFIGFIRSIPQETMYMGSGEIWVMRSNGSKAHSLGLVGSLLYWVT